ncbi:MAG TPA: maleylpyruvate isomerase N-terminal domain-containing protein [Dehalococcoidia bacterium]|nr:maleylpyruvate isomerase N-terminal domain-containing protein [Dehalococcoidia bacterium]
MADEAGAAFPESKDALLNRIRAARSALDADLAGVPDARLAATGADGWSLKDHLAHIAAWERVLIALLRGAPEHEAFAINQSALATLDTDGVNAILRERGAALPPDAVRAEFHAAHAAVLAEVQEMPESALVAPLAADDPRSRVQKIAGDTYLHYDDHRAWIAPLLRA